MKVKVRSLYHSPKGERGIGRWIVGWTFVLGLFYNWKVLKYNFSHEEIWIADENGFFYEPPDYSPEMLLGEKVKDWGYVGQCFSSTTRGKANGVRFAPASDVLFHSDRWWGIEWECEQDKLDWAIELAEEETCKEYDYLGISGFVIPFVGQNKNKWFCSEICDWFKWICCLYSKTQSKVSPRRSAYLLAKKTGTEPKPIKEM